MSARKLACMSLLACAACGGVDDLELGRTPSAASYPPVYATEVVDLKLGPGAGYGQDDLPDVVLGPPAPGATGAGGLAVLSLGVGGEIILGFGDRRVVDGPGTDFVVFENPFRIAGQATVFAELGEVSVSSDGETWVEFPCDAGATGPEGWGGCAGYGIVNTYDAEAMEPLDPAVTGGDHFDLADVGVPDARFIRIRDLSWEGEAPTAGFDLDAVGGVHLE